MAMQPDKPQHQHRCGHGSPKCADGSLRLCVDPPKRPLMPRRMVGLRALFNRSKLWKKGQTILIHVDDGANSGERGVIRKVIEQINAMVNLDLVLTSDIQRAHVRIGFERGAGAWSTVGTDALYISKPGATMNFGWDVSDDIGTVRHEFGHMLGLGHEHQNPNGGIVWDENRVLADATRPPNSWSSEMVYNNILRQQQLSPSEWGATKFDPKSVMLYDFPAEWVLEPPGFQPRANHDYSITDRQTLQKFYGVPQRPTAPPPPRRRCGWLCRLIRLLFGR